MDADEGDYDTDAADGGGAGRAADEDDSRKQHATRNAHKYSEIFWTYRSRCYAHCTFLN